MLKRGRNWGRLSLCLLLSLCLFSTPPVQAGEPFFTDIEDADEWYSETNQAFQPDLFVEDALIEDEQEAAPAVEAMEGAVLSQEESAGMTRQEDSVFAGSLVGEAGEGILEGESESGFSGNSFASEFSGDSTENPFSDGGSPAPTSSPFKGLRAFTPDPLPQAGGGASREDAGVLLGCAYDGRSYLSPVKNQNPYGTCWAFALTGAMEACLLRRGMGLYDLSEDHLAYFFSHRENDPLSNTYGDRNTRLSDDPFSYLQGGQSRTCVSLFLSTWSGMADSALVPYPTDENHVEMLSTVATPEMAYETTAYLQDAVFCSEDTPERYKELIAAYGSLSVNLYMDEDYYREETSAYSYPVKGVVNHSVLLVGWDDSFSRESFADAAKVTSDGAFLARNSWGQDWGEGGYFYISYETALTGGIALTGTNCPSYPNNYFYDGASAVVWTALSAGDAFANVYEVKAAPGECEALGEIVVADYSDDSSYLVQVYTSLSNPALPDSGKPAFEEPLSFHKALAGVGTFSLPKEVVLLPGTFYSVVIQNEGAAPIHYLVDQSSENNGNAYVSVCGENQSFWGNIEAGQWVDLSREASPFCARLKAHTRSLGALQELRGFLQESSIRVGESTQLVLEALPAELFEEAEAEGDAQDPQENNEEAEQSPWSLLTLCTGDEAVATISPQGVVRGVGDGFTYVEAGIAGRGEKLYLPLWVKGLGAPQGLVTTPKAYNKIRLSWEGVEGASTYLIYRGGQAGDMKELARCEETSYTDGEVQLGETYVYQVCAVRTLEEGLYKGPLSSACPGEAKELDAPACLTAQALQGGVELTWDKVSGANGYRIFRKVGNGSFKKLDNLQKAGTTSYLDTTVVPGKKYVYRVKAYRVVNKVKYFSKARSSATVSLP